MTYTPTPNPSRWDIKIWFSTTHCEPPVLPCAWGRTKHIWGVGSRHVSAAVVLAVEGWLGVDEAGYEQDWGVGPEHVSVAVVLAVEGWLGVDETGYEQAWGLALSMSRQLWSWQLGTGSAWMKQGMSKPEEWALGMSRQLWSWQLRAGSAWMKQGMSNPEKWVMVTSQQQWSRQSRASSAMMKHGIPGNPIQCAHPWRLTILCSHLFFYLHTLIHLKQRD